jgi:hypothetical protein
MNRHGTDADRILCQVYGPIRYISHQRLLAG